MSVRFDLVVALCALGLPALAAPVTPEGAQRLQGVFQSYLTATPGFVTVRPAGEQYELTINFSPFTAKAASEGVTASVTPIVMMLGERGDGTWDVTQDQDFTFSLNVPEAVSIALRVGSYKSVSVFDEALMAFSQSTATMTDMAVSETFQEPGSEPVSISYVIASSTYTGGSVAGASGGVDGTFAYEVTGISEAFSLPAGPGGMPIDIAATIDSYVVDGTSSGVQPVAVLGLLSWAVAHPSEAMMMADQEGLKNALSAGLPIFQNFDVTGEARNIRVATPFGNFGAEAIGVTVDVNGVVPDGLFREAISVSGFTMPQGLIPAWAEPLVPASFTLDVAADKFNLASPASIIIEAFDAGRPGDPIDPARGPEILAALLPEGVVGITLAPSHVTSPNYELRVEGAMDAGPMSEPTGKARITLTGADKIGEIIGAAPTEISSQALPAIFLIKGFAKDEGGTLVWEIDATTPGSVLVNGSDLTAMFGGN